MSLHLPKLVVSFNKDVNHMTVCGTPMVIRICKVRFCKQRLPFQAATCRHMSSVSTCQRVLEQETAKSSRRAVVKGTSAST
jgi:hypothetical protein